MKRFIQTIITAIILSVSLTAQARGSARDEGQRYELTGLEREAIENIEANDIPLYMPDEITLLARTVWGEARGCSPEEQALVCWTVFQRVNDGRFPDSIFDVLMERGQFAGCRESNPIDDEILALCETEAQKWADGEAPPVLKPYATDAPYLYFNGRDGHNWFRR